MIKFFRKIRHSLLTENKFSKYLLYAIGEILLVMVGILLPLQVNNWNNNRIDIEIEKSCLTGLFSDLTVDHNYFSDRLDSSKQEYNDYLLWMERAYQGIRTIQEFKDLTSLIRVSSEHVTVRNTTYVEMVNAGKINIIRNDSLKSAIINLYREYETVSKHVEEINNYSSQLLLEWTKMTPLMKYNKKTSEIFRHQHMFFLDEWKWINNPSSSQFKVSETTVSTYYFKHKIFVNYFTSLLAEIEKTRNMITIYLNSF